MSLEDELEEVEPDHTRYETDVYNIKDLEDNERLKEVFVETLKRRIEYMDNDEKKLQIKKMIKLLEEEDEYIDHNFFVEDGNIGFVPTLEEREKIDSPEEASLIFMEKMNDKLGERY